MSSRIFFWVGASILTALFLSGCAAAPGIQPEAEVEPGIPAPAAAFELKRFHEDMMAEMRLSYQRADEILLAVYSGNRRDARLGLIHYFEDFSDFEKETLSWGPVKNVIVQVQAHELKPEIITRKEFPRLSDLDKVGICWDFYEQVRNVFLVEGQRMLIFLQTGYDEASNRSYRNLIDAYPETPICHAIDVFELMVREMKYRQRSVE